MGKLRCVLLLSLIINSVYSQNIREKTSFLETGSQQIKERANFGLVFHGPSVNYGMNWKFLNDNRLINIESELGISILFSKSIPGLGFYLKPVDFSYLLKINLRDKPFYVGPSLKLEYNYNLYPDLQAGFDYWFARNYIGVSSSYRIDINQSILLVKFTSSLFGLVSRQPEYRNPYFYDLGIGHAVRHLHQDLTFGSFSRFYSCNLELLLKQRKDSRFNFGYVFEYAGFYKAPQISIVNHSIKLIINKKQK
jgi:hypothetical protein